MGTIFGFMAEACQPGLILKRLTAFGDNGRALDIDDDNALTG